MKKTIKYVRNEDKKHSVTFIPSEGSDRDNNVLGQVYVQRKSGMADAPVLFITVSTENPDEK